jgi:hypothetical protein
MKDTKALLKEAIADAKAVRETALTQAKLALEEAFTPRLQSMFATKLQEAYDEEEELDEMKDMADENMDIQADMKETTQEEYADHGNEMDEIDLDEILAELENELNEAKGEEDEEEIEAEEDVEDMEDDVKEDEDEEKEVKDLSMDELENLIKDIISQEVGGDGEVEGEGYEDEVAVDAMDMGGDAEVEADAEDFELEESLDAILAELLGEEDESRAERAKVDKYEYEKGKEAGELDERKKYGGNKGDVPAAKRGDKKDTAEEEGVEDYKKKKMEEELQLALEAVETLRTELNEVNLLNAKLLYVNKIFKAKNLNESQKLKVVKAFDKAETAKEAKLVYESLSETFSAKAPKSQIKESLGFASKPAGVAAKQTIVEGNEFITRMQKLANIK